jgi:ketosteroid isomerase-like protein
MTMYADVDEARAAAERLAQERGQAVSDGSTTPQPMELAQRFVDAVNAGDIDAVMDLYAPDAVLDLPGVFGEPGVLGTHEGRAAIRALFEEWLGAYDEFRMEFEERRNLGNGVIFAVTIQRGRPRDSTGWVQLRYGAVSTVVDGLIARLTAYLDVDEARAAAERLAEERG